MTRALTDQVQRSTLSEPGKSDIEYELGQKANEFEEALTLALGVLFEATVAPDKEPTGPFAAFAGAPLTFTAAIPGQIFAVQTQVLNGGSEGMGLHAISVHPGDGKDWKISADKNAGPATLDGAQALKSRFAVTAPEDATLTRAYFDRPDQEQPYYNVRDERFRDLSFPPYPLWAGARVSYKDVDWEIRKVVQTNNRLEGIGVVQEPLWMAPALSVSISPGAGAVPLTSASFAFTCSLGSNVKDRLTAH